MSTDYPYSEQWRERTEARLIALGWNIADVREESGLAAIDIARAFSPRFEVSLEIAGVVDEVLAREEESRGADALRECTVHHPGIGSPRVRRVEGVNLDALLDCRIQPFDIPGRGDGR